MFSQILFVILAFISASLAQSTNVTSIILPTQTQNIHLSNSVPRSQLIYSTSAGYEKFNTVVNGHTVDLISSFGGNSVVTVIEDSHGSKTTIAGQVYTVATGDISTIVAAPISTKQPNSASFAFKHGFIPPTFFFAASAVITIAIF